MTTWPWNVLQSTCMALNDLEMIFNWLTWPWNDLEMTLNTFKWPWNAIQFIQFLGMTLKWPWNAIQFIQFLEMTLKWPWTYEIREKDWQKLTLNSLSLSPFVFKSRIFQFSLDFGLSCALLPYTLCAQQLALHRWMHHNRPVSLIPNAPL